MIDLLRREGIYLWYYFTLQLGQILPYWILGILIGSAISVFAKERIHSLFGELSGKKLGALGVIPASVLGVLSPLCMYGTIPIAASFSRRGIPDDWLAAFMMSSVLLNPQLILYSAALGQTAVILRIVVCLLCGMAAGLLVRLRYRSKLFFDFTAMQETPAGRDTDPNPLLRLLKNILRNLRATGVYFFAGVLLSALYQRYVPASLAMNLFGGHNGFGVLMAATIGVPLYACGGGTIPLLLGCLQNGMSMGAATAFMLTGPATKITNLGAMKIVLGAKRFALYLGFTFVFAWMCGMIVNLFY